MYCEDIIFYAVSYFLCYQEQGAPVVRCTSPVHIHVDEETPVHVHVKKAKNPHGAKVSDVNQVSGPNITCGFLAEIIKSLLLLPQI
jgi:hypothetical protein